MPRFKAVRFQTAEEKQAVYEDWQRFLGPLGLDEPGAGLWHAFTDRLYRHLINHCSFIAHYERQGFFHTYFADPEDTPNFLQQFDRDRGCLSYEYGADYWLSGDCEDINRAMCEAFESHKVGIYATLGRRIRAKKLAQIERLKSELERAGP
jgi:hypothetical protein